VDLGFTYGSISIHNQTLKQAKESIEEHLKAKLKPPYEVFVSLFQSRVVQQQVRGEHLVRQDGTIGLGTYGQVYVTGMTIAQAKAAVEGHLAQFLFEPKVSLDVSGFNSHVYFVIFDYPGTGQQMQRLPITGNETVLDALSIGGFNVRGLPAGVSKRRIWVARRGPANSGKDQILPVDWAAITRNGSTATNYQLLPGDRVFVAPDRLASVDITLSRVFAPLERVFGITLFGNSVIQNLRNPTGTGVGGVR
jgi:polysaccharide biosynthesis/export protein